MFFFCCFKNVVFGLLLFLFVHNVFPSFNCCWTVCNNSYNCSSSHLCEMWMLLVELVKGNIIRTSATCRRYLCIAYAHCDNTTHFISNENIINGVMHIQQYYYTIMAVCVILFCHYVVMYKKKLNSTYIVRVSFALQP